MSLAPLELLSAHAWERVTFTTYALSLSFFEAVILDALIRGARSGGQEALILAEVQGLRGSLSEQGAQRVGKLPSYRRHSVLGSGAFESACAATSFAAWENCCRRPQRRRIQRRQFCNLPKSKERGHNARLHKARCSAVMLNVSSLL